jgi:hypothetical protein
MNNYHAAYWSDPYSSSDEKEKICRYTNHVSVGQLGSCKNPHQLRRFLDEPHLLWGFRNNLLGAIFSAMNTKVLQRTLRILEEPLLNP